MKKIIIAILTAVMIFSTTACGTKKEQISLYEQGLEVVALMDEMADSQSYVQMFTGNIQIGELIQSNTKGDYSEPLAVVLTIDCVMEASSDASVTVSNN